MKKFILVTTILFCSISPVFASHLDNQLEEIDNNVKYSTPKQHAEVYKYKDEYTLDIAKDVFDPKLIEFTKYTKIDEEKYKSKLEKDEQEYQKKIIPAIYKKTKTVNIEPEGVDFYNTYRIAEKIIRANNLDYINWRVAIRKTPVSNAAAFDGNYIVINTGLYDSVYESEEAFAFVIAHEMAHHILGHMQRVAELNKEINFLKAHVSSVKKSSPKNSGIAELSANTQLMGIYKEFRKMEYMADAEALILITKAGYSPYKGIETLNYLNTFNNVTTLDSAHPSPKKRIEAYNENISVLDPNWKYVGIENIYKSDVLKCKKSSDRVSIVISKSKTDKNFYQVENKEQRLTRFAHAKYLRGEMDSAIKYFKKLYDIDEKNFIPLLYISHANEYIYKHTGKKRFLKRAKKSIIKAAEINPTNPQILTQIENLGIVKKAKDKNDL